MKNLVALLFFISILNAFGQKTEFDLVIKNGRVIDPETGLDDARNVGIRNGRIAEISKNELAGKEIVDASGLVVSPGFIDIHAHGQTNKENEYQVHDGVTTALELESGIPSIGKWLASRKDKAIINYGASVSQAAARTETMIKSTGSAAEPNVSKYNYLALKDAEMKPMLTVLEDELNAGALGIGVPIGYYPGATREEIFNVYEFAAAKKVPIFSHVRDGKALAIQQAIADAAVNGTTLHIVHLNSVTLNEINLALRMVSAAQARGMDITTELYPYTAASTSIESALFDEGWQDRLGITYSDLQLVATGERLTKETFDLNRKKGGVIIIHSMKADWIESGIKSPITLIASDGMPYSRLAHPRSAGTFSRVLGLYCREKKVVSLIDALKKMTIMPAQRLEGVAPMMRFKGRIQVGADADITLFDPNTIIDKATFEGGLKFSEGIPHVLVGGVFVVKNGKTVPEVYPGQAIFGKYKR